MLKFLGFFALLYILVFSSEAVALVKTEFPKTAKQGDVVKVIITGQGAYDVYFTHPDGASVSKFGTVDLDDNRHIALIPIFAGEKEGLGLITVFSASEAYSNVINIKSADFPVSKQTTFVSELKGAILAKWESEKAELKKIFAERTG